MGSRVPVSPGAQPVFYFRRCSRQTLREPPDPCFQVFMSLYNLRSWLWVGFVCYGLNVWYPPKFKCWNLWANTIARRGGGLWKVFRAWGLHPHKWNWCPYKRGQKALLPLLPREHTGMRLHRGSRGPALTRHQICCHLDLRPHCKPQNCKKEISIAYKILRLRYFVSSLNGHNIASN